MSLTVNFGSGYIEVISDIKRSVIYSSSITSTDYKDELDPNKARIVIYTGTSVTTIEYAMLSDAMKVLYPTVASFIAAFEQWNTIGEKALPLHYFSTTLESGKDFLAVPIRLYSIFVLGSTNTAAYIQLWNNGETGTLIGTYPIDADGALPVNFGDGIDFSGGLSITNSDIINTLGTAQPRFIFNIRYDLI